MSSDDALELTNGNGATDEGEAVLGSGNSDLGGLAGLGCLPSALVDKQATGEPPPKATPLGPISRVHRRGCAEGGQPPTGETPSTTGSATGRCRRGTLPHAGGRCKSSVGHRRRSEERRGRGSGGGGWIMFGLRVDFPISEVLKCKSGRGVDVSIDEGRDGLAGNGKRNALVFFK